MEQTNNNSSNTYSKYDDISEVGFSVRTYNCLRRAKINTIKDLLQFPDYLLKNIRNMGVKSYQEVMDFKANISIHEDEKEVNPNYDYEAWCILHKNDVFSTNAQSFISSKFISLFLLNYQIRHNNNFHFYKLCSLFDHNTYLKFLLHQLSFVYQSLIRNHP